MNFSTDNINAVLDRYHDHPRWVVGFSGGLDSTVLLALAHAHLQRGSDATTPALLALHINHQLQPAAADWEAHCHRFCADRGISFESRKVQVDDAGRGPEAAARDARYQAFASVLQSGDLLLLAQHRDDQAETVLLNLLRGSGGDGLSGMPARRGLGGATLLRPLLDVSRKALTEWANDHALTWVEDESNNDTRLSRNFLRQRVVPVLQQHWPAAVANIAASAAVLQDQQRLLEEVAEEDLERCARSYLGATVLDIAALLELSKPRRNNLLRYWLARYGLRPRRSHLRQIRDELIGAAPDGQPVIEVGGCQLRRHDGALHCIRDYPLPEPFVWTASEQPEIPGWGRLVAQHGDAGGLRPGSKYRVMFRRGGERAHPVDRNRSTTLKKLFQEYAVPEWERDRWPLLYSGDELAAVPGLFVCRGFAVSGDEPGWYLRRDPINCAPL